MKLHTAPVHPSPADLEQYGALLELHDNRVGSILTMVVSSGLLPLLTMAVGFLFGKRQE